MKRTYYKTLERAEETIDFLMILLISVFCLIGVAVTCVWVARGMITGEWL